MKFGYFLNGKLVKKEIPKNNRKVPKTTRLRKKKFWLKCGDCCQWFRRYDASYGTRVDGKHVCNPCVKKRFDKRS